MIDKLQTIPPDTVVMWHDAVEGNDCEVGGICMLKFHPKKTESKEVEYAYIVPDIKCRNGRML